MTRISLTHRTDLAARQACLFDLHADYGIAYLVERDGRQGLFVNDVLWYAWPKRTDARSMKIKWLDRDRVILDLGGRETAILSAEAGALFDFDYVYWLVVSARRIFVGYSEEELFCFHSEDEPEYYGLCAFSHEGVFEFGLRTLLEETKCQTGPDEIHAAYAHGERLIFPAMLEKFIRILDIEEPRLEMIAPQPPLGSLRVMWGDDKTALAISGLRRTDRPVTSDTYQLAAIDLVNRTTRKLDFAPLESDLVSAGFRIDVLDFQPSASGRIIATDGALAAFVDMVVSS
mgnify:CR=1 FL=1